MDQDVLWRINQNETLGRHLVAVRSLQPGELIIREPPIVAGPAQLTAPVCLGKCGKLLTPEDGTCPKCGWPMCKAKECVDSEEHEAECFFTQQRGNKISISNFIFPHPNYQCITVLRILYQRQHNKEKWDKLTKLQSHCEERKGTLKYENDRVNIAQFIRRFFKLEDKFSEEEIMRVCGILQVNGHEVPLTEQPHVAIYEKSSMFEHNCRPNCCKSFASDGSLLIHAQCNISAGEHLSICYTDPLWGTPDRRHYLEETKFFQCVCERCKDVTEFGTWFSSVKCSDKSCEGYMLPKSFLTSTKSDISQSWYCSICPRSMSSSSVTSSVERVGRDLNAMRKGDIKSCQLFLSYYKQLLHPNHYYLTDVKLALAQLIGQKDGGLSNVTDEELKMKSELCEELIKLVEVLDPAEIRARGTLLFEQHAVIAEQARRIAISGGEPTKWRPLLQRCHEILITAVKLLQYEPIELPEGRLAAQAKENLKQLEIVLK